MKGDFTRLTFDPTKHYRGVLMQQGRVQLDSDWNEQVLIAEHRYSTFFSDFVGQNGTQGNHMLVTASDTKLSVAPGHYYVDGLLVENETPYSLDLSGKSDGFYLCYLDVWERHVTAAEDPDLREEALGGPDTATRLKTEWKIRDQPVEGYPRTLEQASQAYKNGKWQVAGDWQRSLSTGKMKLENVRLEGSDNRLYRVEIHGLKNLNTTRFKWSRDNGSVVAPVKIQGLIVTLVNTSVQVLAAFHGAAFIEVTSAALESDCRAGYLATVDLTELDSGQMIITQWVAGAPNLADLGDKLFIRRWDGILDLSLSAANSDFVELDLGLKVSFTQGFYRPGDYWLIPVRSGIAKDWITTPNPIAKPAYGIEHHFAALAMVEINKQKISNIEDLRVTFNPLTSKDLSTTGDVCIGGKLGVGFMNKTFLHAPLNIQRAADGTLIDMQDRAGKSVWAINDISAGSALYVGPANILSNSGGLSVSSTGNIGIGTIGTTGPKTKLDVRDKDGLVQISTTLSTLVTGYNNGGAIYFGKDSSMGKDFPTAAIETSWGGDNPDGPPYNPQIAIGVTREFPNKPTANLLMDYKGNIDFRQGNISCLHIRGDDAVNKRGFVGIGTTDPKAALHIMRDNGISNENIILHNPNSQWEAETLIKAYSDADRTDIPATAFGFYRGATENSQSGFIVKTGTRDSLSTKFIIDNAGNVGIGTPQPIAKLHVVGGNIVWGSGSILSCNQGGSIELIGNPDGIGTPYIDFNYGNKSKDYNVRIINDGDGLLTLRAKTLFMCGKDYATDIKVGIGIDQPTGRLHIKLDSDVIIIEGFVHMSSEFLYNLPKESLAYVGVQGSNAIFYWKDKDGKLYEGNISGHPFSLP